MVQSELWDLIKKFCINNKGTITWYVLFSALARGIETLIIPKILAKIFTEVNDLVKLKKNIILFLIVFSIEKIFYLISNHFNNKIEPCLNSFLAIEFVMAVFKKYEATHKPVDVAITMEKISTIRQTLEDLIYYVYKLIPIMIIIVITIINTFIIHIKLGYFVLASIIALGIIISILPTPKDTTTEGDKLCKHIEDIFQNMELISSTENGIKVACDDVTQKIAHLRRNRLAATSRVGKNQAIGYIVATILYAGSIIFLYKLYVAGEVSVKNFEANILTLGYLFKLAFDIAYYIPVFTRNIQVLCHNAKFVKELFSHKDKCGYEIDIDIPTITFDNVSFSFGDNNILTNFSYTIQHGDLIALYGSSGSGKTTFTNLILDILQPTEGDIFLGEYNLTDLSKRTIKHHIANVPQNTTSLLQTTIYHNIIYGFEDCVEIRQQVEKLVSDYEIYRIFNDPNFLDLTVCKGGTSLSGGQKQIVHLLHAAINSKARVIILDEPTSALDNISKKQIIKLIEHLNCEGRTIILITHDREIRNICTTVLDFAPLRNPIPS